MITILLMFTVVSVQAQPGLMHKECLPKDWIPIKEPLTELVKKASKESWYADGLHFHLLDLIKKSDGFCHVWLGIDLNGEIGYKSSSRYILEDGVPIKVEVALGPMIKNSHGHDEGSHGHEESQTEQHSL